MPCIQSAKPPRVASGQVLHVLIRGVLGLDATTGSANTEFMVRKVVLVGFPGVQALDVIGPHDVFSGAALLAGGGYDVVVASVGGQPISAGTGLAFVGAPLPDPDGDIDTVVLPGGAGVDAARHDPDLIGWMDGCRVTTHWAFADRLAREFPIVEVDPEPIFVRSSEGVWTAAGVAAGIDLALSLVEDDHGTEIAQTVARWMVLYLRRPGGQTQFAAPVWIPRAKRPRIREVQEAIEAQPGAAHSIGDLARMATMSPRHFTRLFTEEVGEAPGQYVERVRTEAARRQLEETDDTVVAIAARCGFGTAETMRRNFIRRVGVSPDQYRKTFA